MKQEIIPQYPLQWPAGWPRSKSSKSSRFGKQSIATAAWGIQNSIRLFRGTNLVISTNLKYKSDGMPYSNQRPPDDKGVAIYFKKDGIDMVMACDTFDKIEHNLYAIERTVEAMRQMDRDGCSELLNRMFTGFKALPAGDTPLTWFDALEISSSAKLSEAKVAYYRLVKKYHPEGSEPNEKRYHEIYKAWEHVNKNLGHGH